MDSRDIYRHRLSVEECLLDYQRSGYEGNEIVLRTTRRFLQNYLELLCKGSEHDRLKPEDSAGFGQLDLLSNLNLVPQYYRDGDWNALRFRLNRKGLGSFTALVSMAVSPVPGGGTCVYMVIFAQRGRQADIGRGIE